MAHSNQSGSNLYQSLRGGGGGVISVRTNTEVPETIHEFTLPAEKVFNDDHLTRLPDMNKLRTPTENDPPHNKSALDTTYIFFFLRPG